MNTSLVIGVFCFLLIPGAIMVLLHHSIAFLLEKLYESTHCKSDGIVRKLRDASIMGYAEEWWQHLWYWLFFSIRALLVVFGIIFSLCMTSVVTDGCKV